LWVWARILVIDSDAARAARVAEHLRDEGFAPATASSALAALAMARSESFALVIASVPDVVWLRGNPALHDIYAIGVTLHADSASGSRHSKRGSTMSSVRRTACASSGCGSVRYCVDRVRPT
jgi:CheY-like chemotaxis protein